MRLSTKKRELQKKLPHKFADGPPHGAERQKLLVNSGGKKSQTNNDRHKACTNGEYQTSEFHTVLLSSMKENSIFTSIQISCSMNVMFMDDDTGLVFFVT